MFLDPSRHSEEKNTVLNSFRQYVSTGKADFFEKYKNAEPEERKILMKEMKSITGFTSKDFRKRFNYLTRQYLEEQK